MISPKPFRVTLGSHHAKIDLFTDAQASEAVLRFLAGRRQFELVRAGRGRLVRRPTRTFAVSNTARTYYSIHVGEYDAFVQHMGEFGYKPETKDDFGSRRFAVVQRKRYVARRVELKVRSKWEPRDYQVPAIDYIADTENGPWGKLLTLQTGRGKGYCTMQAIANRGVFAIYIMRPSFMDKWAAELVETYESTSDDFLLVTGGPALRKAIMQQAEGKLEAKALIISNKTFQRWIKDFESTTEAVWRRNWPCTPWDFFEFMQAGFRVIDEGHMDFHLNYKQDCYANVLDSITLTATLLHRDPFLRGRYEIAYPKAKQYQAGELTKYIDASTYFFAFAKPEYIHVSERGATSYSHNAVEASIMRSPKVLANWLKMVGDLVQTDFYDICDPDEKFAVFCYRRDFCQVVCEYLKQRFQGQDIRTYIGGVDGGERDPYENLIDPVGRVTTYGSAGTAQDIPMLRTTIMTVAMDTLAGNIQVLGRTRQMKSGNTPYYTSVMARNLPKHLAYQENIQAIMQERARTYRVREHPGLV